MMENRENEEGKKAKRKSKSTEGGRLGESKARLFQRAARRQAESESESEVLTVANTT